MQVPIAWTPAYRIRGIVSEEHHALSKHKIHHNNSMTSINGLSSEDPSDTTWTKGQQNTESVHWESNFDCWVAIPYRTLKGHSFKSAWTTGSFQTNFKKWQRQGQAKRTKCSWNFRPINLLASKTVLVGLLATCWDQRENSRLYQL